MENLVRCGQSMRVRNCKLAVQPPFRPRSILEWVPRRASAFGLNPGYALAGRWHAPPRGASLRCRTYRSAMRNPLHDCTTAVIGRAPALQPP